MATHMSPSDNPFQEGLSKAAESLQSDPARSWRSRLDIPENDDELWEWVDHYLNIQIPRNSCCSDHSAPFDAFSEAYFAKVPRSVWIASRLVGKTVMLAALSLTEAITLGASVCLLGGSGEQSKRCIEYFAGKSTNLPTSFWASPNAPTWIRDERSTQRRTYLKNGGEVTALMASHTSVRGNHPQRTRGDEIDDMSPEIWDAAQGLSVPARGIDEHTLGSSTWHHSDKTVTREINSARKHGWKVHFWCYKCVLEENGGFLSRNFIERKKASMSEANWNREFELGRPSLGESFIVTEALDWTFDENLGNFAGQINQSRIFEEPQNDAEYASAADWGSKRDRTIIVTLRTDCDPMRVVQYAHMGKLAFPVMVDEFNKVVKKYDSYACHDATGLGSVIHDYLEITSEGVVLQGRRRKHIFSEYVKALEQKEIKSPDIEYMREEHEYAIMQDIYGSGHPPDSVVAMALAYRAAETLDIVY